MNDRPMVRRVLLVAGLCCVALGGARPDAAAQDATAPTAATDAFEACVRRHVPGMTTEERDDAARRNGALRVTGRTRLSGCVLATSVHVERGAEVELDRGLVLYALGDIVIEAPIGGSVAVPVGSQNRGAAGSVGARGADGADIVMLSATGDIAVLSPVNGQDGASGASVDVPAGSLGRGGAGGRGGDITIRASKRGATITIQEFIQVARGGPGGSAVVRGVAGGPGMRGRSAKAFGGDGGGGGKLTVQATNVAFVGFGSVGLQRLPNGGDATADGGAGGAAPGCLGAGAGAGGAALAIGGASGRGSVVMILAESLLPDPTGLLDVGVGSTTPGGSRGGDAIATGGDGGLLPTPCEPSDPCPARGRRGSNGGSGGDARAEGGDGRTGSRISGSAFAGLPPRSVENPPAKGGSARAVAGSGTSGGGGETAEVPGAGGTGGAAGDATAVGGNGGACAVGIGVSGLPVAGGAGGDATITEFANGSGGGGGNCCNRPGGKGAPGGAQGTTDARLAIGGRGGKGAAGSPNGQPGTELASAVVVGVPGLRGAGCPIVPTATYTLSISPASPNRGEQADFSVRIENPGDTPLTGLVVEIYHEKYDVEGGPPFLVSSQTVDVAAAGGGGPGVAVVTGSGFPPNAGSGQVFRARVNGASVGTKKFTVK